MIYTVTLNPALDRTLTVPTLEFNQVLRVEKINVDCGGKGFNVSRALKLLGVESKILGFIGGAAGETLAAYLLALQFEVHFIHVKEETRTNIVVTDEITGKHIKVNEPGPRISQPEQQQLIVEVSSLVRPEDIWVLSGSLPPGVSPDFYSSLVSIIQAKGAKACLDTSGDALVKGLSARPFLIKPNRDEAQAALGVDIKNQGDLVRTAQNFHEMQIPWVAISCGAGGLLLSNESKAVFAPAPAIHEKNSVGAGDALLAGLVWAYSQGKNISEMAAWGVAAGSCAARLEGVNFGTFAEIEIMVEKVKREVRFL